jgi:hypothetical protein
MVNQIGELSRPLRADPDPIRLVRMVKQIGELSVRADPDPIRLVRMVNQIGELAARRPRTQTPSASCGW